MSMKYGLLLPQGWSMDLASIKDPIEAYETMTQVAQTAEECGYNSIWLADHFHTVPLPAQEMIFECWASAAAVARDTKRIRIGQMVTGNGYRNPALLAKMASTVDILSHGRLNFGIGSGWYQHEYDAYGYEYPDTGERLRQLAEAVQVILAMWTQEEATFEGKYYQIHGAINQPKGVQKPHIPLLIAGGGEQVTLKLVAQYADTCNLPSNIGGTLASIEHKFAVLKQHCEAIGRDYNSIYRTILIYGSIADTDELAMAKVPDLAKALLGSGLGEAPIGTPETIRQRLAAYEAVGVQELLLLMPDTLQLDSVRRFAKEFIS